MAISPNSPEVHIYHLERGEWKLEDVLKEHDLRVTGVDWAANTNRFHSSFIELKEFHSYGVYTGLSLVLPIEMHMFGLNLMTGNGNQH